MSEKSSNFLRSKGGSSDSYRYVSTHKGSNFRPTLLEGSE